jgi:hypothetical protein
MGLAGQSPSRSHAIEMGTAPAHAIWRPRPERLIAGVLQFLLPDGKMG